MMKFLILVLWMEVGFAQNTIFVNQLIGNNNYLVQKLPASMCRCEILQ